MLYQGQHGKSRNALHTGEPKIWKYFGENSEIFAIAIHAVHTGGNTMYENISEKTLKFLQY